MFIKSPGHEMGVAADITEDVISGQIVRVSRNGLDSNIASLVSASGDLADGVNWGLAYYDPLKAVHERPDGGADFAERVSSITSKPKDAVARVGLGTKVTVLTGRFRGWTNMLVDGVYGPGTWLTVDTDTAKMRAATGAEVRHAQVELTQRLTKVASGDDSAGVSAIFNLPVGL